MSRPAPYRGDSAYLHAAESLKSSGQSAKDALSTLRQSYKSANPTELTHAVNEVFGQNLGTRNYVVFDEKLIEIVKKYGIAGAVSAGLLNEAQARQLADQGYQ